MQVFTKVFPTLKLTDDLAAAVKDVYVAKVATTPKQSRLYVYIQSSSLLPRKIVKRLEAEIKRQLLAKTKAQVVIREDYHLSKLYTPENLWKAYKDSIFEELGEKNRLLLRIMEDAKISFDNEETMRIRLQENVLITGKEDDMNRFLKKVFETRCNIPVKIFFDYEQKPLSEEKRLHEEKMRKEIERVLRQMAPEQPEAARNESGSDIANGPAPETAPESGKSVGATTQEEEKKAAPKKGTQAKPYSKRKSYKAIPADPNLIWGKNFDDPVVPITSIAGERQTVTIRGQIFSLEVQPISEERKIVTMGITDFEDSVLAKLFLQGEEWDELSGKIREEDFVLLQGTTSYDKFAGDVVVNYIRGIKKSEDFREVRMDLAPEKRVELHCHTKMSEMDGVSDVKDILETASRWDMPAIAITDHGVVHGFPDAFHAIGGINKKRKQEGREPMKIIYGMEGYLVNDEQKTVRKSKGQPLDGTFVVFDLETTGLSAVSDRIIEIGAAKVCGGEVIDSFQTFVNPKQPIPAAITRLTSINDDMVIKEPPIEEVLPRFLEFVGDAPMVAHNAGFDMGFIEQNCRYLEIPFSQTSLDTVMLSRILLPGLKKHTLDAIAKELDVSLENHHRAIDDATCTAEIFTKMCAMLKEQGIDNLDDINAMGGMSERAIRKLHSYHIILLAANEEGRKNLYRLVSMSHLKYFGRRPLLPKSEILKHREGLIIGSACEQGELYQALLEGATDEKISEIVRFYDYLEIQPVGNNAFMIDSDRFAHINSEEDLREVNRRIVELGEKFKKPVVATCDVHFLEPQDEIYRRIIMARQKFDDADRQPPLYLHTTQEMLDEFAYLGGKKAREVVIDNTRAIADRIEVIEPVRPDKRPPIIENSDETLRKSCYDRAKQMYGDPLPEIVEKRLEAELNSIISNGYSVMYIIAQKLVRKANEDGYVVGSRGSVGSSFAATMSGITEVNPLPAHYYCPDCNFTDFDSEIVKPYTDRGACGWDLPRRTCPNCGRELARDGFGIPFETFLGFEGDKEPDIDLNFSGEYQNTAHKYTEEIFGEGQTFKAGTITTVADNTAFGFVKNYYEDRQISKRSCEVVRIAKGLTGIRRSTGQHPGGIIVLPYGEEIHTFTPVQHPANKKTDIVTTHFDYHSIDHNLLKLDILGHDDPTVVRKLEQMTGIRLQDIPLDDPDVMSLFAGTEALKIKPEDIHGCKLGCMGIPEFGTEFVIQMVQEAKPKSFSDLIRISGLSHGTEVWIGNAQTLLREGRATLETAICLRDDIMGDLIRMGLANSDAFKIMESVRKGRGLSPEQEKTMVEHEVPDWYIWSCKRISYMFPKAHAVAYCMMAYRIAYCKINYPLQYYASYFSVRAENFDYETTCKGPQKLKFHMEELMRKPGKMTKTEKDTLRDMRIAEEMYARGYSFMPIDVYEAKAKDFRIIDGKIMPAFSSLKDMGEIAALAVETESKKGKFLSLDDFKNRTKVSQKVIDYMNEEGMIGEIPTSNQFSLFD